MSLVGASTLLATSGVLTVAAATQRWWLACGIGAFDTAACLRLQDHAYDYTSPRVPWVPVGAAAELQGMALLLLAAAVLMIPGVLGGRRPGRVVTVAAAVMSAGIAVVAVATWLSGREGQVVTVPRPWLPAMLWILGLPALVMVLAVSAGRAPPGVWVGRWAVVACVSAGNPFGQLFVAPLVFGYTSHDTTPWAEAVGGVFLIGASGFLWLATYHNPLRDVSSADASVPQRAHWFATY